MLDAKHLKRNNESPDSIKNINYIFLFYINAKRITKGVILKEKITSLPNREVHTSFRDMKFDKHSVVHNI